jgi:hypothetical protein
MSEVMTVTLTRSELVALKETIEVTPRFEGRTIVRDAIQRVLRERRSGPLPLCVEESALASLARRIVPIDVPSATIKSKLRRALPQESLL